MFGPCLISFKPLSMTHILVAALPRETLYRSHREFAGNVFPKHCEAFLRRLQCSEDSQKSGEPVFLLKLKVTFNKSMVQDSLCHLDDYKGGEAAWWFCYLMSSQILPRHIRMLIETLHSSMLMHALHFTIMFATHLPSKSCKLQPPPCHMAPFCNMSINLPSDSAGGMRWRSRPASCR